MEKINWTSTNIKWKGRDVPPIYLSRQGLYDDYAVKMDSFDPSPLESMAQEDRAKCLQWISDNLKVVPHMNPKWGSYKLKHVLERAIDGYVSNGAAIDLMLKAGFIIEPIYTGSGVSLNCRFNAYVTNPELGPYLKG